MLESMNVPSVRGSGRVEAYSDALFSIVATVMIVPITHTEIPEDTPLQESFVNLILPQLVVYIFTFLVICHTWGVHVWLFEIIEKVDEFLVLLNLALMMVITFLPYTFTLLGSYYTDMFTILLFCGTLLVVGLLQFIFILYVFHHPTLWQQELRDTTNWRSQRNHMCATVLTPVALAVLAAIFATFSAALAIICLIFILFGNFLRKITLKIYTKLLDKCRHPEFEMDLETSVRHKLLKETVTKERAECFSDGVFAIVSTIIILDICDVNIPPKAMVQKSGSVAAALSEFNSTFLAYGGVFITVALLWYVHHSLLHYIKEMNKLVAILNNLCLLSIGGMPLAFKLSSQFDLHQNYQNETLSIEVNCVIIFLAGLFQLSMWIAALFTPHSLLPEGQYNGKEHAYMTAKLAVYPIISFIVYCVSFAKSYTMKTVVFNWMQIGILGIFLLLQVAHIIIKKCRLRYRLNVTRDDRSSISGLDTRPISADLHFASDDYNLPAGSL